MYNRSVANGSQGCETGYPAPGMGTCIKHKQNPPFKPHNSIVLMYNRSVANGSQGCETGYPAPGMGTCINPRQTTI